MRRIEFIHYRKMEPENFVTYQPEYKTVDKSDIYSVISCLEKGIEYASEWLIEFDLEYKRRFLKHQRVAEIAEKDILDMKKCLKKLKEM